MKIEFFEDISTKDVCGWTGLTCQTLQKYVAAGWIPAPKKISKGRKTGVQLHWSTAIIEKIKIIQLLKKNGLNSAQISTALEQEKEGKNGV